MSRRATYLTAFSSYFQLASVIFAGLMSIPLALHYLNTERVGLWTFTAQSLGYLFLVDFGVSNSIGRLIAEPLQRNDPLELSRWYSLITVIQTFQGLLIFVLGYLLVDWILHWFNLPPYLLPEARHLWLLMLGLNAVAMPLRMHNGILFAQNRAYWSTISGTASLWIGLLAFWLFLRNGAGSLAYGYSSLLTVSIAVCIPALAVWLGPNSFRLSWRSIDWRDLRQLFGFSSYTFLVSIAVQVVFMSQEMILTKNLGLAVVAGYNISIKAGLMGMQIVFRSFDAHIPRWQQMYVSGDLHTLRGSYRKYFSLALGMILSGMLVLLAANRTLVFHWAKPELYQGRWFDLALGIFLIQSTITHCLGPILYMAKHIRACAICAIIEAVVNILLGIILTKTMGPVGMLIAATLAGLTTMIYFMYDAPKILGDSAKMFFNHLQPGVYILGILFAFCGLTIANWLKTSPSFMVQSLEVATFIISVALFIALFKSEISDIARPIWRRLF